MTQSNYQKTQNSSEGKTDALARIVCMRVDELLHELGISLSPSGNKYVGRCPVHGGRKFSSLNLYPDGHTVPGYWKCRSHHCEQTFKKTIIGFVRGVLSRQKYNWEKVGDRTISFEETIKWLCDFIKQDFNCIKVDVNEVERRKFAHQVSNFKKEAQKVEGIAKNIVRSNLEIPAKYYIDRGYSPGILNRYDVGVCTKQGREMSGRVVVPVYNDSGLMIGCTGRATIPSCLKCGCYHNSPGCPPEEHQWLYSKWKNNEGFLTGQYLYNYWNAKKYIQDAATVIIVEGPGDVWRLEEAGIHNSVGLFGCELTDEQQILLESSGAMNIIILLDNDEPGRVAITDIRSKLQRFYNIFVPEITTKDIGDMSVELIQKEIMPIIESIQRR